MHDFAQLLTSILTSYALPPRGDHGVVHWARVYENGQRLAASTGADAEVVGLFALLHDSRRVNEWQDRGHGLRAGDFARSLRGTLIELEDARFELLHEACALHTDGRTTGDPTLLTCWDADRLDLGRVGITPLPHRLCTDAARAMLDGAHERAKMGFEPTEVLRSWGWHDVATPDP